MSTDKSAESDTELKSLVHALQRRISHMESEIESLQNKVEHRSRTSGAWQGAKADVVDSLVVGETYRAEKLIEMQTGVNEPQRRKNTKVLLKSDWFENKGDGWYEFCGNPDDE